MAEESGQCTLQATCAVEHTRRLGILAHSILQCGVGFPYFSPAFYAVISGCGQEVVVGLMSIEDIREGDNKITIKEVS